MLADVSGSMQAYSRVYLRVLQGAVLGARAHAYVFATQLHPVTRALGRGRREDAIARALPCRPMHRAAPGSVARSRTSWTPTVDAGWPAVRLS